MNRIHAVLQCFQDATVKEKQFASHRIPFPPKTTLSFALYSSSFHYLEMFLALRRLRPDSLFLYSQIIPLPLQVSFQTIKPSLTCALTSKAAFNKQNAVCVCPRFFTVAKLPLLTSLKAV